MRSALLSTAVLATAISSNAVAANEAKFNECRSKLVAAQKLDLLVGLDYKSVPPSVTVGKTFFTLPYDAKQGFAEAVNCVLNRGESTYINFDMLDWRTNKVVAQWSYGKVKVK